MKNKDFLESQRGAILHQYTKRDEILINSTLCYIEKDGKYLMLHRIRKENDANRDKWIGIGGKFVGTR